MRSSVPGVPVHVANFQSILLMSARKGFEFFMPIIPSMILPSLMAFYKRHLTIICFITYSVGLISRSGGDSAEGPTFDGSLGLGEITDSSSLIT